MNLLLARIPMNDILEHAAAGNSRKCKEIAMEKEGGMIMNCRV